RGLTIAAAGHSTPSWESLDHPDSADVPCGNPYLASEGRAMRPRFLLALAILFLFLLFLWFVFPGWKQRWKEDAAEKESIRLLAEASAGRSLEEAVGHLGIVFRLREGSWIAIRYRDSHVFPMWSSAVALDSKGNWFRSTQHYCGRFMAHRGQKQEQEEWEKL